MNAWQSFLSLGRTGSNFIFSSFISGINRELPITFSVINNKWKYIISMVSVCYWNIWEFRLCSCLSNLLLASPSHFVTSRTSWFSLRYLFYGNTFDIFQIIQVLAANILKQLEKFQIINVTREYAVHTIKYNNQKRLRISKN